MRRTDLVNLLGMAAIAALLGAGCANTIPPVTDAASPGEQAIDAARGLTDDDEGGAGSNTGTWGGVQTPSIQSAPHTTLAIRSAYPDAVMPGVAWAITSRSATTALGAGHVKVCLLPRNTTDAPNAV